MFGDRLKLARASAGLSLRELADRIGNLVTAQALGKYERDEMLPSSAVLIALAEALNVPESYLLSTGEFELENVEFRKLKGAGAKEQATLKAQVLRHTEKYLEIEDVLAAESTDWKLPVNFPYRVSSVEQAEFVAESLRQAWQLGQDPIPKLAEFLEERGIKVLPLDLAESISGMTAKVQRRSGRPVPVIVINANHPGERQRFTLAHELGHLVIEAIEGVDIEQACNRFAGAFLVAASMLCAEVGLKRHAISPGELRRLKQLFLVSVQCLIYRLKDLEIITSRLYTQLFVLMGKLHWRKREPDPLPKEETQRFERLCFRALVEGLVSESKAAELLDVTIKKLSSMVELGATA
jgi:Zn-dependent peptidase ImmA (M78 family)/transcriptional regulator with XRE-family HTH domain